MHSWWKRFKPNQSTLPAALLATAFCGICLLLIWTPTRSTGTQIARYGEALSQTLAHSNAGLLLHQSRIELAVIANQVTRNEEVAGAVFYSASNEIIALSGSIDLGSHFTAPATLDDTITGYVSIALVDQAFAPPFNALAWLLTLAVLAISPFLSLGILQLSARGNRSLPIVSVPEPISVELQPSFCLTINLHNQLALSKEQRTAAVADAMNMAQEVCAIYQGIAVEAPERGIVVLFDQLAVGASEAICASFLIQRLLDEFETNGSFRCYLTETECPGAPADIAILSFDALQTETDIDSLMTLAALARAHTVLLSEAVYAALLPTDKAWAKVFAHPLLEDMSDADYTYTVEALPEQQEQLIDNQATLILGFNQASA